MRDPQACGRLRRRPVDISGTVFHPLALPQVIEDCFALLLAKAAVIPDPFERPSSRGFDNPALRSLRR